MILIIYLKKFLLCISYDSFSDSYLMSFAYISSLHANGYSNLRNLIKAIPQTEDNLISYSSYPTTKISIHQLAIRCIFANWQLVFKSTFRRSLKFQVIYIFHLTKSASWSSSSSAFQHPTPMSFVISPLKEHRKRKIRWYNEQNYKEKRKRRKEKAR